MSSIKSIKKKKKKKHLEKAGLNNIIKCVASLNNFSEPLICHSVSEKGKWRNGDKTMIQYIAFYQDSECTVKSPSTQF